MAIQSGGTSRDDGEFIWMEHTVDNHGAPAGPYPWAFGPEIPLNPNLRRRWLFAYHYNGIQNDLYGYTEIDVVLSRKGRQVLVLPLNFYWKAASNAGTTLTRPSALMSGGLADILALTLNLNTPYDNSVAGHLASASETQSPVLKAWPMAVEADECRLYLVRWGGSSLFTWGGRTVIVSYATE